MLQSNCSPGILPSEILGKSTIVALIAGEIVSVSWFQIFCADIANWSAQYAKYNAEKMADDLSCATQCYNNQQGHNCGRFVTPALPYATHYNAPCPFASKMSNSTYRNLLLDSSKLGSLHHLGLNDGHRFSLRYRTYCALLNVTVRTFGHLASRVQSKVCDL